MALALESWQKVWRDGMAPLVSDAGLVALAEALRTDDPRLEQGSTTKPPPLQAVMDWPVEAACLIGYCGWQEGEGRTTVQQVEEYFARLCYECDQALGEPAGCRYLLNWFDDTPRDEMRRLLLPEVERTLFERQIQARSTMVTKGM